LDGFADGNGVDETDPNNLNIMYDKRVFRGNTYNMTMLKQ
jgi:hypothetical protein